MKRTTKRIAAFFMTAVMLGGMVACGNNGTSETPTSTPVPTTAAQATTAPTTTPVPETYDFGGVTVKCFGSEWNNLDSDNLDYIEAKAYVEQKYNIKLEKAAMEGYDGYNDDDILISSIAAGDPACHIINLNPEGQVSCFVNDLLFDITDMLDTIQVGSIYTDVATWKDRVYGVAYENIGDAWVLVYDRQLLADIGMEKTPTEMFMEGKWDYESFRAYCVEMKSKLPDGVYPIANYPYHWGVMSAGANGAQLVSNDGKLNIMSEAIIEAAEFYQSLVADGLAYPSWVSRDADGNVLDGEIVYAVDDDRIVMKRAEVWQLGGLSFEYGITYWPWGSNVTCTGDYTTLSDNYAVTGAYWGFDAVVKAAVDATGIPGEVLTMIAHDYRMACSDKDWMHDAYVSEQAGDYTAVGAEYGEARSFYTQEDIELFDWGHSRYVADLSWALDSADVINVWKMFQLVFAENADVRSTFESYYNEAVSKMNDIGLTQ